MALNFQNNERAPRAGVLVIILLVASLLLVLVYGREGDTGPLHSIQGACEAVATPFERVGNSVGASAKNVSVAASDATAGADTLSGLQEENAELRNIIAQLEEYRQEASRLQTLLNIRDTYQIEGATARVVGRSGEAYSQTITLDAGSNDGVDVGQTVMGTNGVVGQVISVAPASCTVRLLTDPQSGAAVLVQSSRAEGVVRGSLDGLLYLENIDNDVEVNVGDVVVTSGLGGSYVSGLLVGTVVRIDANQGSAARTIIVSPNEDAGPLSEVIVIRSAIDPTASSANANTNANANANGNAAANANSATNANSNSNSSASQGVTN